MYTVPDLAKSTHVSPSSTVRLNKWNAVQSSYIISNIMQIIDSCVKGDRLQNCFFENMCFCFQCRFYHIIIQSYIKISAIPRSCWTWTTQVTKTQCLVECNICPRKVCLFHHQNNLSIPHLSPRRSRKVHLQADDYEKCK